jgi:O-antigen/teichoic acid export membrane protein
MLKLVNKIIREDNFLSLTGNLVIAFFGFAGFALLARSLTPHDFGQWVLFISGGSLIEMLRHGVTSNGLVRFLSGASEDERDHLIGANVVVSFTVTLILAVLLIVVYSIFHLPLDESGYGIFFKWYPVVAFINLPFNNALVVLQAKMEYGKILLVRSISTVFFFIFLVLNFITLGYTIEKIVIAFIIFNSITSIYCIVKTWDGIILAKKANKKSINTLLNFGKYSTFTLIGTNLLKNADVILISISPFGSAAVALFSIPLKLTELQLIPLRSFAATAYPKMSKASIEGRINDLKDLFNAYSGALTYLFFFISLITFFFAKQFVILISGQQYLDVELLGIDVVMIVKIFSLYGLLLPIDRMTGIGLDSVNKPKINALKVMIMLAANIIGDLVAIYVFKSIEMVAVATLVFTTTGILVGMYYLDKSFKISYAGIFRSANSFYKNIFLNLSKR